MHSGKWKVWSFNRHHRTNAGRNVVISVKFRLFSLPLVLMLNSDLQTIMWRKHELFFNPYLSLESHHQNSVKRSNKEADSMTPINMIHGVGEKTNLITAIKSSQLLFDDYSCKAQIEYDNKNCRHFVQKHYLLSYHFEYQYDRFMILNPNIAMKYLNFIFFLKVVKICPVVCTGHPRGEG